MSTLANKVAIITGAAQGQGAEEARLFVERGASVVITDVDAARAEATARAMGSNSVVATPLDVRDAASWHAALAASLERFDRVDVLVNNAGRYTASPLLESDAAQLDEMLAVNLFGVYHGLLAVGGHMVSRGSGSIVNVASVAALAPAEGSALYGATKAAVVALTKGAALELGPAGVRVNAVLPGAVDTAMMPPQSRAFFETIPLGRMASAGEIARAAAFLASDDSSYCSGTTVVVDGGWTLGTSRDRLHGLS